MTEQLTAQRALSQAWLIANFMWQDEAEEGQTDGCGEAIAGNVTGELGEKNGSPVFGIFIQGSATSDFGYSYPLEKYLAVEVKEDGELLVRAMTDEEEADLVEVAEEDE